MCWVEGGNERSRICPTGSAVRVSGLPIEAGPEVASTDSSTPVGLPRSALQDGGGRRPRAEPARDFDRGAPVDLGQGDVPKRRLRRTEASEGSESALAALLGGRERALGGCRGPAVGSAAGCRSSPLDTASHACSASTLCPARCRAGPATTGIGVPQDSPVGQDDRSSRKLRPRTPRLQATSQMRGRRQRRSLRPSRLRNRPERTSPSSQRSAAIAGGRSARHRGGQPLAWLQDPHRAARGATAGPSATARTAGGLGAGHLRAARDETGAGSDQRACSAAARAPLGDAENGRRSCSSRGSLARRASTAGLAFVRRGPGMPATTGVVPASDGQADGRPASCTRGCQAQSPRSRQGTGIARHAGAGARRTQSRGRARVGTRARRRSKTPSRFESACGRPGGRQAAAPSPEPLASVAGSSERAKCRRRRRGRGAGRIQPLPTDRSVAVSANEPPRTSGAAPLPAQQVAGQIVAAAHAIQREEAQPTGTLAAKPAVVIGRQSPSPRASAGGSRDHHHPHVAQAGRAGYSRRSQPVRHGRHAAEGPGLAGKAPHVCRISHRRHGGRGRADRWRGAPDGRSQTFLPSSTPQHGGSSQPDSRSSGGRPNAEPDPRTSRGNQNDDTMTRAALRAALAAIFMCSAPALGSAENACEREMARAARSYGVPLGVLYAVGADRDGARRLVAALCAQYRGQVGLRHRQGRGAAQIPARRGWPAPR